MSQKIKAPNEKGAGGFLWGVAAIIVIAAVVIAFVVWKGSSKNADALAIGQDDVDFSVTAQDNKVTLKSDKVAKDAPVVDIYEDFSCPHCADLVTADNEDIKQAVSDGKMTVNLHFLNFLDGGKPGSSTRAAAVATVLAENNPKAFWNMHAKAFLDQDEVARQWGWEQFADSLKDYNLDDSVINSIRDGSVQKKGEDVAAANTEELKQKAGKVSAPVVYADGKEVQLKRGENGKPSSWVSDVVKG